MSVWEDMDRDRGTCGAAQMAKAWLGHGRWGLGVQDLSSPNYCDWDQGTSRAPFGLDLVLVLLQFARRLYIGD